MPTHESPSDQSKIRQSIWFPGNRSIALIAIGLLTVGALVWFSSSKPASPQSLSIYLVGYTNAPGGNDLLALFVVKNGSGVDVSFMSMVEVKTASGWPQYGSFMRPGFAGGGAVLAGRSTTFAAPVPDHGIRWRVALSCSKAPSEWDRKRLRWARTLYHHLKLVWITRLLVRPPKERFEVAGPELSPRLRL